jgi:membrane associated rhomboid family serine protease
MSITVTTCADDAAVHSVIPNTIHRLKMVYNRPQSQKFRYRKLDCTSLFIFTCTSSDHTRVTAQPRMRLIMRGGFDFLEIFRQKGSDGQSLVDILWDVMLNKSIVTTTFLLINLIAFALANTGMLGPVHSLYCCPYDVVQHPVANIHRVIVSSFMHLSPGHIISNMIFWSVVGQFLEQKYGRFRMLGVICTTLVLVGSCEISIALLLSAVASIPNFLENVSYLFSRGGASQAYVYKEMLGECSLETQHAGFSGILFALSVVQVAMSCKVVCMISFSYRIRSDVLFKSS